MSDVVIKVENLGKKYRIRHEQRERYTALRDVLANKAKAPLRWCNQRSAIRNQQSALLKRTSDVRPLLSDFWHVALSY